MRKYVLIIGVALFATYIAISEFAPVYDNTHDLCNDVSPREYVECMEAFRNLCKEDNICLDKE